MTADVVSLALVQFGTTDKSVSSKLMVDHPVGLLAGRTHQLGEYRRGHFTLLPTAAASSLSNVRSQRPTGEQREPAVRRTAMLARPTARDQYWPIQNTLEPLDLNEGTLLEQRD